MKRRDFLKGMGALFDGVSAEACSPHAEIPTPAKLTISAPEHDKEHHTSFERIAAPEVEDTVEGYTPRTSAALEARIAARMQELRSSFGAEIIFDRAQNMRYEGAPLMELVRNTFAKRVQVLPSLGQVDRRSLQWLISLCCNGQVTAESAWDITA